MSYLLYNIYVRYGNTTYRQVIGIHMDTNCAPLIADLFLFCYESEFMTSLNKTTQVNIIDAFNDTSRYLDDILNIDNPYFDDFVKTIYPKELTLNKANSSDKAASFLDLDITIKDNILSTSLKSMTTEMTLILI